MITLAGAFTLFFSMNSLKFLAFGVGGFNEIVFNFFQSASITASLYNYNSTEYYAISDLVLWGFFGLSPHTNMTRTIYYLGGKPGTNSTPSLLGSNHTASDEIDQLVFWFGDNKYIITIISVFVIIILASLVYLIAKFISRLRGHKINDDVIRLRDGHMYHSTPEYWTGSYRSYMIKVLLVVYCNLSSMTIYQLVHTTEDTIGLSFIAFLFTLFIIIGFPCYIMIKLYYNKSFIHDIEFIDDYGSLYLYFKDTPIKNQFMIFILAKQVLYSIVINISNELTYLQNTLLLVINITFFILLVKLKPYIRSIYQKQAIITTFSMIVIIFVNYIIISESDDTNRRKLILVNLILHGITFLIYVVSYGMDYCQQGSKPDVAVNILDIESNNVELIPLRSYGSEGSLDVYYNTIGYVKPSAQRFTDEIKTHTTAL